MRSIILLLATAGALLAHGAAIPNPNPNVGRAVLAARDDDWDDRGRDGDWDDDWDDQRAPDDPAPPAKSNNGKGRDKKYNVFHPDFFDDVDDDGDWDDDGYRAYIKLGKPNQNVPPAPAPPAPAAAPPAPAAPAPAAPAPAPQRSWRDDDDDDDDDWRGHPQGTKYWDGDDDDDDGWDDKRRRSLV
ncbi:hypothetical protein MPH_07309 [Macrophomina phaseolina MS6]|uniref:Uncharacterized protein n=1 Tax=Macrophomina phaseolina (strain MS6) TaxID=1126212 RepID=K2RS03_MACPH|nr:hypothetical protein MPH_07309 [Macrophomina phaseolina MS6]